MVYYHFQSPPCTSKNTNCTSLKWDSFERSSHYIVESYIQNLYFDFILLVFLDTEIGMQTDIQTLTETLWYRFGRTLSSKALPNYHKKEVSLTIAQYRKVGYTLVDRPYSEQLPKIFPYLLKPSKKEDGTLRNTYEMSLRKCIDSKRFWIW